MEENGKIKILCTTEQVGYLARAVGGESVDVLELVDGRNDPHSYRLVKGDNEKFRRADALFFSGLGLEASLSLRRCLPLYHGCDVGGEIVQKTHGAIMVDSTVDPHLWMDLSLWAEGAQIIANKLSLIRPDLSSFFTQNAAAAKAKLLSLHEKIRAMMHSIPQEQRYLVTTHDAFHYFCRAYLATDEEVRSGAWRERCLSPEGFAPESQISTRDLDMVVSYILRHQVRELFAEAEMNQDSIQKIIDVCRERGYEVALSKDFLYSDTMDGTYEKTMEHNADVIFRGLNQ
jgi:manganese/zinc/iron transport system substrate-binding protein